MFDEITAEKFDDILRKEVSATKEEFQELIN